MLAQTSSSNDAAASFIAPSRMPKEVRADPEVAAKLEELDRAARLYMAFDMQRLQADTSRELDGEIARLGQEFKQQQAEAQTKLRQCEQLNKSSQALKSESASMRQQKLQGLREISQRNAQFEERYAAENRGKEELRAQMLDLEKRLRELQREIATTNLENEALRALLSGEQELREERDAEETHALLLVNEDLKQSVVVADEERRKSKKQREVAEGQASALEKSLADSRQRVQELLQQIGQGRQLAQEQAGRLEQETQALGLENKQLRLAKEKNEAQLRGLERELQQVLAQ